MRRWFWLFPVFMPRRDGEVDAVGARLDVVGFLLVPAIIVLAFRRLSSSPKM
jgi:hypothetical protein